MAIYLNILSKLLTNEALHYQIRGKLGAYHVEANFNTHKKIFTILTQGDGVPCKSYEAIKDVIKNAVSYVNDETVELAVVSILKYFDQPELRSLKGMTDAMNGITREKIQKNRDILLNATADNLKEACKFLTDGDFNVSIAASREINELPEGFEIIEI